MTWREMMEGRIWVKKWSRAFQWIVLVIGATVVLLNQTAVLQFPTFVNITIFIIVVGSVVVFGFLREYYDSQIEFDRRIKVSELLRRFSKAPEGETFALQEIDERTARVFYHRLVESCDFAGIGSQSFWVTDNGLKYLEVTKLAGKQEPNEQLEGKAEVDF